MTLPSVLLLAPHYPPETVAGAARMRSFADGLRALGHEVTVVAPAHAAALAPAHAEALAPAHAEALTDGVVRVAVAPRGQGRLATALHAVRLLRALGRGARRAGRPDVLLVSSPPPVAALAFGAARRAHGPLPLVVDVRDVWPDVLVEAGALRAASPAAALFRMVERRLLRSAAAVVTVTEAKRAKLAARTHAPVTLVTNGVDEAWSRPDPAYRGGRRPLEVLHAGNVGHAQDVELLVRAVRDLAGEARGVVVGGGQELERVRALAAATGADVTFLPSETRESVRERLAGTGCACVTLRTSALADSVPTKLLEAMARGVPVVAAVAGEAAAIVEQSGGGMAVPPGDARALAGALRRVADMTPEARVAMGARGRAHVLGRWRREDAVRVLSAVLVEAARTRASAPVRSGA